MKKWFIYLLIIVGFFVVLTAILRILTSSTDYQLNAINISQNQVVGIFQEINFEFNKNIDQKFFSSCQIEIGPDADLKTSFEQNILKVSPASRFQSGRSCQLTVACDNFAYLLNFQTKAEDNATQDEIQILQTQLDFEVARGLEQVYTEQPWRKSLPLKEPYYTVVYSEKGNYLAESHIPAGSGIKRVDLELEIKEKLAALGAPDVPIIWR